MSFALPVDPGLLLLVARAVGDATAADAASAAGRERTRGRPAVLPLTWTRAVAEHHDADGELRRWPGGSPTPRGGSSDQFHAEQHFEYHRAPFLGEVLRAETRGGATWRRQGRSGDLSFAETVTDFTGEDGDLCVRSRKVGVRVERPGASAPRSAPPPAPELPTPGTDLGTVTRAAIARYAGASGDVNRVHVDEPFALAAGHPAPLAHGMLTMGLTGSALTSAFGHARVASFGGRFLAPVLAGDRLTCMLHRSGRYGLDVSVQTTNQSAVAVFRGSATLRPHHLQEPR